MLSRSMLLALAATCCSTAALAQAVSPRSLQANKLGLMEFCQSQGFSDAEAVQAQRIIVSKTAPGGPVEAAEATGRGGSFTMMDGTPQTLADWSAAHHMGIPKTCALFNRMAIANARR